MVSSKVHKKMSAGKRVGGYHYVHRSAKCALSDEEAKTVKRARLHLPQSFKWSVLKVEQRNRQRVSFLDYEDFELSAFPALLSSCSVDLITGHAVVRNYGPRNPPILHRKELLLRLDDPRRAHFETTTRYLEKLGLFREMHKMGRKRQWTFALAQGGLDAEGRPIGQ